MSSLQNAAVISKDYFPKIDEIEKAFAKGIEIDGEEGFIIGHDNLIDITKKVLEAVSLSEKEIPIEVEVLVKRRISHFLNADNTVLEQYHHGARIELTYSAYRALQLVSDASTTSSRVMVADLGLQSIKANQALLDH